MFAEELKGNANRKRQEQARERRKKAKEELQLKKREETKGGTSCNVTKNANDNDNTYSSSSDPSTRTNSNVVKSVNNEELIPKDLVSTSSDAVVKAMEQRKIRALQKKYQSAALIIQSVYRSYKCVVNLGQSHRTILEKRISDLSTLGDILKKQQEQTDYIPPSSLVNVLLNQILFLTHGTPRLQKVNCERTKESSLTSEIELKYFSKIKQLTSSDVKLLAKVLDIVILPGILGNDVHLDPSVVWLQSKEGKFKVKKLLRLVCHSLQVRQMNGGTFLAGGDDIVVIEKFIRVLIGVGSTKSQNKKLISFCRDYFFLQNYDYSTLRPGGKILGQCPLEKENLDLIHLLRSFMLYPYQNKSLIIPPNAEEARESSIMNYDRERADIIFRLVLEGVLESRRLYLKSRFFAELISIPLLMWKVESRSSYNFVQIDNATGSVPFLHFLDIFIGSFTKEIANGLLSDSSSSILPTHDVPLNLCPAPPVLCLFGNLVQLGFMCPMVNGDRRNIDYDGEFCPSNTFLHHLQNLIYLILSGQLRRYTSIFWQH